MLRMNLLGRLELEGPDGRSTPAGDPGKKVATWLAIHPNAFTDRDRIAEQLWPGGSRQSALNSLGRGLVDLRRCLAEIGAEAHLRVAPPKRSQIGLFDVATDLSQFRALRDTEALNEAVELLRERPLCDLSRLAGVWIENTEQELLEEGRDVLGALAQAASAAGDDRRALKLEQRRLELDPFDEVAVRQAALCHQRLGQQERGVALLRQFQLHTPLLAPETLEVKQALETRGAGATDSTFQRLMAPPPAPALETRYAPTNTYEGTTGFDAEFNNALTRDLEASRSYYFRGISAKYVPTRLALRGPGLDVVRVMMLDPSADEAVRLRAVDRFRNPKHAGQDVSELADRLRVEILRSIVALFDCRHLCTIDVGLIASTAVDRIEMLDDSAFVSLYHGPRSLGRRFPETMRYARGSVAYEQHRIDCLRQFDLARHRMQFRAVDEDATLQATLGAVRLALSNEDLATLRADSNDFAKRFRTELNDLKKED